MQLHFSFCIYANDTEGRVYLLSAYFPFWLLILTDLPIE